MQFWGHFGHQLQLLQNNDPPHSVNLIASIRARTWKTKQNRLDCHDTAPFNFWQINWGHNILQKKGRALARPSTVSNHTGSQHLSTKCIKAMNINICINFIALFWILSKYCCTHAGLCSQHAPIVSPFCIVNEHKIQTNIIRKGR